MEHNQEKALHLLGIARKANRLAIGEEPAGIACRSGKARLLLVAQDAGEHTVRRAQSFCRSGKPAWMQVGFTKEELGNGLGCNACALCAVLDPALAAQDVVNAGRYLVPLKVVPKPERDRIGFKIPILQQKTFMAMEVKCPPPPHPLKPKALHSWPIAPSLHQTAKDFAGGMCG